MLHINLDKVYRYFLIIQYVAYKAVGLSPWTLKMSRLLKQNIRINNQNNVYKISYIGSTYNILLMLAYVLYDLYFRFFPNKNIVHIINNRIYQMLMDITSLIKTVIIGWILVFYVYKQKSMMNVIDQLNNVNQKLDISVNCYSKNFLSYFVFIFNFLISITKILLMLPYSRIGSTLHGNFSNIIFSWIIMQFTLLLGVIDKQLEAVNSSINKIGDVGSNLDQPQPFTANILLTDESCRKTDNIKKVYIAMCAVCEEINDLYGLPILISILHFSFQVIHNVHFFFIISTPTELLFLLFYVAEVMITPWAIFLGLVLTSGVSKTTDQSKQTGQIISLLSKRRSINPKIKEQLTKFSSDLSHFKIEFSAWGALPLDRDLLGIACGTIATFLVIIIQGADVQRTPPFLSEDYI